MANISKDHEYHLVDSGQTCSEGDVEWMDEQEDASQDQMRMNRHHTPVKSPNPKKIKKNAPQEHKEEISNSVLFKAIQTLTTKFDTQSEYLKGSEFQLQENIDAVKQVKESVDANTAAVKSVVEDVNRLKVQMVSLQKENASLREMCLEHARYKRRWSLRLIGLPEKEEEITREEILKILSKVISVNIEELRNTVDTVHRLGQKGKNNQPRQIIIQFGMRIVRDQVWRMSKNAKICKELNIRFKEDFCKEDRESRQRLWPRVEEARKRGLKAFLKDGYAVIDGHQVTA